MSDDSASVPPEQLWSEVTILALKPLEHGALVAELDLELPRIGLTCVGCKFFSKNGKEWVRLPQENYVDGHGQRRYKESLVIRGWAYHPFQAAAVAAIHAYIAKRKGL